MASVQSVFLWGFVPIDAALVMRFFALLVFSAIL